MNQDSDAGRNSGAGDGGPGGAGLSPLVLAALGDVALPLEVRIGKASMSLEKLLECSPGSVIELDTEVGALAEVLVGGRVVARGELVAVDDMLGVRIVDIPAPGGSND